MDHEMTMKELAELINGKEGEFMIRVEPGKEVLRDDGKESVST